MADPDPSATTAPSPSTGGELQFPAPPEAAGAQHVPHIGPRGRLVDPGASHEERTFALLMHASVVLMHVLLVLSFAVPLVMWLARRDSSRFLADHGKESVNFHISIALYGIVGFVTLHLLCLGAGILAGTYLLAIIGGVLACTAASRGEYFRYPMCLRFIR